MKIPRSVFHLFEIVGFAVAGLILVLGFLGWRLSEGPIEVRFLTPYLEQAFSQGGITVEIGRTVIGWQGARHPLRLLATDVRVIDREQPGLVSIPEIQLSLSGRALLEGRIVPSRVELVRPALHLARLASGEVRFGIGASPEQAGDPVQPGLRFGDVLVQALAARPEAAGDPLAGLAELVISDGQVVLDDHSSGVRWFAPSADIDLVRSAGGVIGRMRFAFELGGRTANLNADLRYDRASRRSDLSLQIAGLIPSALVPIDPLLAPLAAVASPVTGTLTATLGPLFRLESGRFSLAGGPGQLVLDGVYPAPVTLAGVVLAGSIDGQRNTMRIDEFTVDFGGPRMTARADLDDVDGTLDMVGEAEVTDMPIDLLGTYWPEGAAANAREWVLAHLSRGVARSTQATFHLRAPFDDLAQAVLVALDGQIDFDGVDAHILEGLPSITGIAGQAVFDRDSFQVRTTAGQAGPLAVPEATVTIHLTHTQEPDPTSINLVAAGPVREALAVMGREPIGYHPRLFDAGSVTGQMSARLRFDFPLKRTLRLAEVALAAAANLRDVTIVPDGRPVPVDIVAAALSLDGQGMTLNGTGALAGEPLRFDWSERFGHSDYRTRIDFQTVLNDRTRHALALPDLAGVTGRIGVAAVYTDIDRQQQTLSADLDFTRTRMDLDWLGWSKPPGSPGHVSLELDLADGALRRLSQVQFDAPGLRAGGAVDFAADGQWQDIAIDQLTLGQSSLAVRVDRAADGAISVAASGPSLDVRPWLDQALTGSGEAPAGGQPRRAVTLAFDRVVLGDDAALQNVAGRAAFDGTRWSLLDITGQTAENSAVALRWDATGGQARLDLRAADAGATLRSLGIADDLEGGQLVIVGAREAETAPLTGQVWLDNYRVRHVPVLARLLAAISVSGLQDLMSGTGLDFNRLRANYAYSNDVLTVDDARTSGGSLGLTMDASVDLAQQTIDARGTVVPIYGLNNMLGSIPLLGSVLTGGAGQGVFAFTYSVNGPLDDPTVWVNPLAALAPGFLRNLFFLNEGAAVSELGSAPQLHPAD